jgi:methyl-accepting chemotaxis protein
VTQPPDLSAMLALASLLVTLYVAAKVRAVEPAVKRHTEALEKLRQEYIELRRVFTDAESAKALWASGIHRQLEDIERRLEAIGNLEELHKKVSAVIADVRQLTQAIRDATAQAQLAGNVATDAQEKLQEVVNSIADLGKSAAMKR